MAKDDCAVLVGIARYFEPSTYPPLQGPVHDVASVYDWLIHKSGGDVPKANIRMLVTGEDLLAKPYPKPEDFELSAWKPSLASITAEVFSLIFDTKKHFIQRPNGRLYLYFSGHGFTNEKVGNGAALFTAEAGGDDHANLGGTLCAEALANMRVFGQIVLIMDCCRDELSASPYGRLNLTDAEADGAQRVPRLEIYAGPKGVRAQEGALSPEGPIAGYLTNAVLRALREAPPNVVGQISANRLNEYITWNWSSLVPAGSEPPTPRIHPPFTDQAVMYFPSGRQELVDQEFSVPVDRSPDFKLWLQSVAPNWELPRNVGMFTDNIVTWVGSDPPIDIKLSQPNDAGRQTFTLRLLAIPHEWQMNVPGRTTPSIFTPGGGRVDL